MSDNYYVKDDNEISFDDFYKNLCELGIEIWFTKRNDAVDLSEQATKQAVAAIYEGNAYLLDALLVEKLNHDD